jgi:integrase
LEVTYRCGGRGAKRTVKCIRSITPDSLVFQGLQIGGPMNDQNIRQRHVRLAALKLGIDPKKTTWQSFRRSYLTWLADSGANPKDIQAQGRHSRISTPMEIYAQHVPESQRRAVEKMMSRFAERRQQQGEIEHVALRSNSAPVLLRTSAQSESVSA